MPLRQVYVLSERFPRRVVYRDATIAFEIIRRPLGGNSEWIFRARKLAPPAVCELLTSRLGKYGLETTLFRSGFSLPDGTPAARLMARLVREGYATARPARRDE